MLLPGLLLCALLTPGPQAEKPTADVLIEDAWLLMPAYDGSPRPFLVDGVREETQAAAHLLRAGLALNPAHVRGLWSLGHAEILLADDRKNRGEDESAQGHYDRAIAALGQAITLQPSDPWARYARGAAHTSFGDHRAALEDLASAVTKANVQIQNGQDVSWLRFKALEWQCEVLMRAGDHEAARSALNAFHDEFSTNDWPKRIALAENHLRERDFAGAREQYLMILEGFPSDHQAYALLGYLHGLLGDAPSATKYLMDTLEHELVPDLYTRMWLWILATEDYHDAADEDLRGFLQNPPNTLSAWDLRLGRFLIGEEGVEDFLRGAEEENARRMEAGEALDDLMCEAWFYAGLRRELDANSAGSEEDRTALVASAREAFGHALFFRPTKWKWEWAFARRHFKKTSEALAIPAASTFQLDGGKFVSSALTGTLRDASWHRVGAAAPAEGLEGAQPGDLLMGTVLHDGGRETRILELIQ